MMQKIKNLFRKIRNKRFSYKSLVQVILNEESLLYNFHIFQNIHKGLAIAPVLKSNAYGHGLIGVAQKLDSQKPPFFVVDSYYEALVLKNEKISSDVLVLGYTYVENILEANNAGIVFCITTLEQLEQLSQKLKHKKRFHIKIDTGMHRQGVCIEDIKEAVELIHTNKNIILDGVCSHLADADVENSAFNEKQIRVWNEVSAYIKKEFPNIRYTHIEATAGTAYANKISANVARVGLGLYGIDSGVGRNLNLKPVLRMESIVVGIKHIKKGEGIGYNNIYIAPCDMAIGVVPAGYFEGIPRALSNKGCMKVKGIYCPIVGRVNMNMTVIDVSDVSGVMEGDTVEIISAQPNDKNSVISMAQMCQIIPYEILVKIPEKLRRVWK